MSIPTKMKAAVLFGSNDLRIVEKDVPVPGQGEALVKVKACAICGSDPKILKNGHLGQPPYGEFTPGHEFSGEVVAVGHGCIRVKVGDRVAAEPHKGCGVCINCMRGKYTTCLNYGKKGTGHHHYGFTDNGGYAEYAVLSEKCLHKFSDAISYEHATLLTTAGTALYGIQNAGWIHPGDTVLVIGPGPVGLLATHFARLCGAGTIIVAGTREERLNLAKRLGADILVNIHQENPVERVMELTDGLGVDMAIETSGSIAGAANSVDAVKKNGRVVMEGIYGERAAVDVNRIVQWNLKVYGGKAEGESVIDRVIPLMERGLIDSDAIVTHTFSLYNINQAFETYINRVDNAIKVVVKP